jgi:hypothetical protein
MTRDGCGGGGGERKITKNSRCLEGVEKTQEELGSENEKMCKGTVYPPPVLDIDNCENIYVKLSKLKHKKFNSIDAFPGRCYLDFFLLLIKDFGLLQYYLLISPWRGPTPL